MGNDLSTLEVERTDSDDSDVQLPGISEAVISYPIDNLDAHPQSLMNNI